MLIVALGHALNMHVIHGLAKVVNPFVNIFYTHVCLLIINSLMCNIHPMQVDLSGSYIWLIVFFTGLVITNAFTQYGIILANSIKAPSLVMPFGYVGVLVGFCVDVYFFGSTFSFLQIVGTVLTSCGLLSGFVIAIRSGKEKEGLKNN